MGQGYFVSCVNSQYGADRVRKTPVSVEYSELYTIISLIFTFIVGAVSYWKNNSFTSAAIEADKFMHEQRIAEGEDDNGTSL